MVLLLTGWVGECWRTSSVLALLFFSQKLKNFLLGYFSYVALCQWENLAVVGLAGDDCDSSGYGGLIMLWSS